MIATTTDSYDVIVVGSGINGLVAAAYQALKGRKVLVLEAEDEFGGAIKTRELTLPGFKHDALSGFQNAFANSRTYRELKDKLVKHGLKYVSPPNSFGSIFPGDRFVYFGKKIDDTCNSISQVSEKDAKSWRELYEYYKTIREQVGEFLSADVSSVRKLSFMLMRFYMKMGREKLLEMMQLMMMSPRSFSERYFETKEIRSLLSPWAMHPDMSPETSFGGSHAFLMSCWLQDSGTSIAVGGNGSLISAFVELLHELNAVLLPNSRVAKIIVSGEGRAEGVKTIQGKEFRARKAVIANVEPRSLFLELVGRSRLPEPFYAKISGWRYGTGSFKIDIALDGVPDWVGGTEPWKTGVIHLGPYLDDISEAANQAVRGLIPTNPFMIVGHHTNVDSSRAPAGKHTLWINCRCVPGEIRGDSAGEISTTNWDEAKTQFANRCLRKLSRYITNLDRINLGVHVQSPLDIQRANSNLVGGDSNGGSVHLDQHLIFRPFPGQGYRTPIKALYITGAFTWPGAGMSAVSGYNVARIS